MTDPSTGGGPAGVPVAAAFGAHHGVVVRFDDHHGAGSVTDGDGTTWSFHCTRIAGGRRSVAVDASVTFRVTPGPTGLEATEVTEVPAAPPG